MAYVVHYGSLRTGKIISELPVASCTFGDELRGLGSFSATVAVGQAGGGALWNATRGAATFWALEWSSDFGREIIAAGPIFARSGDDSTITFGGSNLFGMLSHRRLVSPTWSDAQISALSLTYSNLDLGSIMAGIVAQVCTSAPADLPIVLEAPRVGINTRTYFGYDLADAASRISELGNVEDGTAGLGGPDWLFAPRFHGGATVTVDFTRVEWLFRTGSAAAPTLTDPVVIVLDRTAFRQQNVGPISVSEDAANLATVVFASGGGSEVGKVIATAADATLTSAGYPRMDATVSSNSTTYADVSAQAAGLLTAQRTTPSAVTVTVRADQWWAASAHVGTTVRLLDPHHPMFGKIDLTSRVMKWSADVASTWVTLTLADSLTEV